MTEVSGERRIVSVLVADVADSTVIGERLGPERTKFLFDEVARLMAAEVRRFEGTVAQLTGDGLYALFGVPSAHEDDPERAVRAALSIQDALRDYARDVEQAYDVALRVRVAVNTGPVVVPAVDAPPGELYNALGDTVNVASRLQLEAGPDGIAVGPETARCVGRGFRLESLGELRLKGKEAALPAYRVVAAVEATASDLPLVGREAELATLCAVLDGVQEGRGAIVSVTGEAGIGKSRLVREAQARYENSIRFLAAHAVSYASAIPYVPVRGLLRSWLGLGVATPEARLRLELKSGLDRLVGGGGRTAYPFLANLAGLKLEGEDEQRFAEYASDSVQLQTHEAVLAVLRALARERPLALLLEDLHWADEPTLAVCEDLYELCEEEPIAIVLLHRGDPDHGSWETVETAHRRFRHRYTEIALTPLASDECARLATGAAGAELPPAVAALLFERSGGNPLFVEQLVRDLLERGALARENGGLRLVDGAGASLPTLVQELLQARLDHLGPAARRVVSVAAVVGSSFSTRLLEQLEPAEVVRPALSELQRLELVVEERRRPVAEYRFRHGLVRDAAYGSLTSAGRRALHRRVGEGLEQLVGQDYEAAYGTLAVHFAEADDPAKAAAYLLKAGDAANVLDAHDEAVTHYRRALSFLERFDGTGRARQTLFKIARAHHTAFDFERANAAWQEAFALPEPDPVRLDPTERLVVLVGEPDSLLPSRAYAGLSWWLVQHLFRGLLALDREQTIVPDVAERLEVSPDGRRYRFRLRRGIVWSDGAPVTADDFASTWRAMRDERTTPAIVLDDVVSAGALDTHTLEVRLRQGKSYVLDVLASSPSFPWPRHVRIPSQEEERSASSLVGNGPFVLVERDAEHALLRASATWRGPRGNVGEIELPFIGARDDFEDDWRSGRGDVRLFQNRAFAEPSAPQSGGETHHALTTSYVGFRADVGLFTDERVRAAFSCAVDREAVARATTIWAVSEAAAGGIIPPAMPGHSHRLGPEFDPARARGLLAAAGHPGGRGLPRLSFVAPEWERESARELVSQWSALGADVEASFATLADADEAIANRADVWFFAFTADYPDPDGMLPPLLAITPLYRDAEIEALLERAQSIRGRDERLRLYREAERLWIAERSGLLPVAYLRARLLRRPWVEGLWGSPGLPATLDHAVVGARPEPETGARR